MIMLEGLKNISVEIVTEGEGDQKIVKFVLTQEVEGNEPTTSEFATAQEASDAVADLLGAVEE